MKKLLLLFLLVIFTSISHSALIRHWDFHEGSGTTADDIINADLGTFTGNITWVTGKDGTGYALSLADANCGMDTTFKNFGIDGLDECTIMFWIRRGNTGTYYMWQTSGGNYDHYGTWVWGVPNSTIGWNLKWGTTATAGSFAVAIDSAGWHNFAFTGKRNDHMKFYLDGVYKAEADTADGAVGVVNAIVNLFSYPTHIVGVIGQIDDWRVYSTALTAEEILAIMNGGATPIIYNNDSNEDFE